MPSRPEDRYVSLTTKTLPNGRVVYASAIPINIDPDPNDLSFVAGDADRMDVIAKNVYGSAIDWWKIAAANKIANGTLHIHPGLTIFVPAKT